MSEKQLIRFKPTVGALLGSYAESCNIMWRQSRIIFEYICDVLYFINMEKSCNIMAAKISTYKLNAKSLTNNS